MSANVVEHFTADDKIAAPGKWIRGQVKAREADIVNPRSARAARSRAICEISAAMRLSTRGASCAVKWPSAQASSERPRDPGGWKQREGLLVFRLLVRVGIFPGIGLRCEERSRNDAGHTPPRPVDRIGPSPLSRMADARVPWIGRQIRSGA